MAEYWISLVLIYFSTQSFGQSLCAAACSGDDMEIFFVGEQFMQMSEWPLLPAFVDVCTFKGEFEDWQTTFQEIFVAKEKRLIKSSSSNDNHYDHISNNSTFKKIK